ncbi:MAG: hypothetical protein QHH13_12975 [Melioribacter sp.]|uniref:hypothetical protein n=1 Tax=Rosettibacter primus TaxID=3111523 RepID=UPI00247E11EB|nr:hypothetical protein [Melioribacter sp.]
MKTKITSLLFFIAIIELYSLPRFSMRLGDKCSDCHINPTGGMIRNENGFFFGKNVLSMISPREKDFSLSQKFTENVSFGFDYRSQFLYSQEKNRADFQDMTGSIYLNAGISKKIDVAARYDFVQSIWEAFAIARILPNESYIKIGSFTPYFGIRLDDHTSYTRGGDFGLLFSIGSIQGLIYNPFYIETGIELGANLTDITHLTFSIGKSKFNTTLTTDPTITSRFEITPSLEKINLLFGGSFASTKTKNFGATLNTLLYGGFLGIGTKYFSLMGEFDIAKDYIEKNTNSSAMMIEATYQLMVGLDAVVRYDNFDINTSKEKDEHAHLVIGFEFFPFSFIELRPQYRINLENPNKNNNALVLQFHFWY